MSAVCPVCFRHCVLEEGQTGACRARVCRDGQVICANYGAITSLSLDPIEKKPLRRFYPGSQILSVGSYGCNMSCPFCQNHDISMAGAEAARRRMTPEALVGRAAGLVPKGNLGLAFTYNEPLVGYEFVRDCAALARSQGLKTVLVTNGAVCPEPLGELLPLIDAANVDLKGFVPDYYRALGGDLRPVKASIVRLSAACHLEVTTLILPGVNDSEREMDALAAWLRSLSPDIPLHVSRFFPRYRMAGRLPTPVETVYRLANVARGHLRYVYTGNC